MSEPDRAADYRERDVEAAHAVLSELGQVRAASREQFVIVGGAVPWLLLPDARPPHIGTLDLDLDLDPEALAGGGYAALVEALEKKGYERGVGELKPFQLRASHRGARGSADAARGDAAEDRRDAGRGVAGSARRRR